MPTKKRMRMFAGPNGSGKSTIFQSIKDNFSIGHYINADDIEYNLRKKGFVNLQDFGLVVKEEVFSNFKENSTWMAKAEKAKLPIDLVFKNNIVVNIPKETHSYEAAFLTDFIRTQLLNTKQSFSFETVMSHPSKLDILRKANELGYRTYLYFVCTDSPRINVSRVNNRVEKGGHPVPKKKIESRYFRTLDLLADASVLATRTFLFDNSKLDKELILEVENSEITIYSDRVPNWVESYLMEKLIS